MSSAKPTFKKDSEAAQDAQARTLPNYLHIGPAKAGSTWIYNLLTNHSDIFTASGKGLYYFDSHFDRGEDWYLKFFEGSETYEVRGEVSHGYLPSPEAPSRIASLVPSIKLSACLRDPVARAFSAYLDGIKNGHYPAEASLSEAIEIDSTIIDHGRYGSHLTRYLESFHPDQILLLPFGQLSSEPQALADRLCEFLKIKQIPISENLQKRMMPAARPRSKVVTKVAKGGAHLVGAMGFRAVRGRVKRSRIVRNLLYAPYSDKNRPQLKPEERDELQEIYRDDVRLLDQQFESDFSARWGFN